MNAQHYVDQLFADYEPTAELDDFKEEVLSNLQARIADLTAAGRSEADALSAATGELGDIGEVARQMSRRRGQEVIADAYLGRRVRPTGRRLVEYIVWGCLAAVLLAAAVIIPLALVSPAWTDYVCLAAYVLIGLCAGRLVYLGCTQETTTNLPLPAAHARGFAWAGGLLTFGLLAGGSSVVTLSTSVNLTGGPITLIIASLAAVVGIGLLIYYGVTKPERRKPWAKALWAQHSGAYSHDQERWVRFGLLTVALWLVIIAAFVILGLAAGFQYSWTAFLLGLAAQFALLSWAMKGSLTKPE